MNLALSKSRRLRGANRRGATLVLIAVMSTVLVSLGALVINWAYIELTNTQLRSASDAAAKAALVTISQTQKQGLARQAAKDVASEYRIGGKSLVLSNSDIEFGNGKPNGVGGYSFTEGEQPLNCARVTARCGPNAATASVPVLFASLLPQEAFDLEKDATAGRYDHDICVVVDRSASMAWDLTGVDFSYPSEFSNDSTLQNYFRPPYMGYDASEENPLKRESRWGALVRALEVFRDEIDKRDLNAQVGLVSYASNYTFGLFESSRVTKDQMMSPDTNAFVDAAKRIGELPIIGDTHITSGVNNGRSVLLSSGERRLTANRTMILLSDGRYTEGPNPLSKAKAAAKKRITVHTISFGGDETGRDLMQEIADETGGVHYHVENEPEGDSSGLQGAFKRIAEELPSVLIQ